MKKRVNIDRDVQSRRSIAESHSAPAKPEKSKPAETAKDEPKEEAKSSEANGESPAATTAKPRKGGRATEGDA